MIIVSPFLTALFSFGSAQGVMIFPFIFLKGKRERNQPQLINHERIHLRQALELLVIGFYMLYLFEFLFHLIRCRNIYRAYRQISMEQEAYAHDSDLQYFDKRRPWSFCRFYSNSTS